jgi:ADP-ribose pyrophosphatase
MPETSPSPADSPVPPTDTAERWPVAGSAVRYDGGWVVRLREDQVRRPGHPDDEPFTRVVVEHPGAAIILAVDDQGRALVIDQYRHAVEHRLVQLPAGLCDIDGEDPAGVARRELAEEAGFEAAEWTHLTSTFSSPGITSEISHYYLARGLRDVGRGDFEPEHEEAEMTVSWVPVEDLATAVLEGRLADAHLALAVLLARSRGLTGPRAAE